MTLRNLELFLYLMALFAGIACVLSAMYNFLGIIGSIKPKYKRISRFMGPFTLIYPGILDKEGEKYKVRFIISVIGFSAFFLFLSLTLETDGPAVPASGIGTNVK
jgi:hypothetical protein